MRMLSSLFKAKFPSRQTYLNNVYTRMGEGYADIVREVA